MTGPVKKFEAIIPTLKKFELVIFDLDGTIVDLNIDWAALKLKLSEVCLRKHQLNLEFTPLGSTVLQFRNQNNILLSILNVFHGFEKNDQNYLPNLPLINYLKTNKLKNFAIYSMNTDFCLNLALKKYVLPKPKLAITLDNCQEPKPSPKDLLKIIQILKVNKSDAVFVGDSERKDLVSGNMAGIKTLII